MADAYYSKESIRRMGRLRELKPDVFKAFGDFDQKVFAEGALNTRVKELIAVACAHNTQCPWCIAAHTKRAKKAGATDTEIAEAIFVAMSLRAGGAMAHSAVAFEAAEETA
jgi:AhpD family alkylhydroperoxidase